MDSDKHNAFERLEIVETGRRRRWSEGEKLRIVMESLSAPRFMSATARRHGISRSQLGTWLRTFRTERHAVVSGPAFVPAVIAAPPACTAQDDETGMVVVELPNGGRMRFPPSTPPALASAILRAMR